MFVGREKELEAMNRLYKQEKFQMVVLYGRRRIGKTTFISHFIQDKSAIFFTAQEANDIINLAEFSKRIYRFFNLPITTGAFGNWNEAFSFLGEKAKEQRFILVFDEFPYAAEKNRALRSILQNSIDHELKNTNLFLILCGSHVGFMENKVLGYKSPLFGRRTSQIKLEAFDYFDSAKMLDGFGIEDKIKLYACIGGTPHYLAQVNKEETFEENIKRLYFDIAGYLYIEPMMLLQQELREPAMYNSIVVTIAAGASRLNEIATRIGETSSKVNKYIQTLINLQIVQKVYPFGEDIGSSRKGIYRLSDNCYDFWFHFVFPNLQEIESNNGDLVADQDVFGEPLSAYIGKHPFEDICKQYLIRKNRMGGLPFQATSSGSWWGNDPAEKKQTDIDVVMANRTNGQILFGECKWKKGAVGNEDLTKLTNKTRLLSEYKKKYFYFFSKSPYPEKLKSRSDTNVILIGLNDLFDI